MRAMASVWLSASVVLGVGLVAEPAAAASQAEMMAVCRARAHEVFRLRLPDIDTSYEGQRVDGTHAVNGTAYTATGNKAFQCSFSADGRRIVRWVVRGR